MGRVPSSQLLGVEFLIDDQDRETHLMCRNPVYIVMLWTPSFVFSSNSGSGLNHS